MEVRECRLISVRDADKLLSQQALFCRYYNYTWMSTLSPSSNRMKINAGDMIPLAKVPLYPYCQHSQSLQYRLDLNRHLNVDMQLAMYNLPRTKNIHTSSSFLPIDTRYAARQFSFFGIVEIFFFVRIRLKIFCYKWRKIHFQITNRNVTVEPSFQKLTRHYAFVNTLAKYKYFRSKYIFL